jgi:hypothetical protein
MRVETPVGHLPEQDTLGKNSMTAENATSSRCPRPEELRPTLSGSAGQPLCLISTHHWAADGNPQQLIVRNAERAIIKADLIAFPRDTSTCFPKMPMAKITEIVRQLGFVRRTTLARSFRDWVRDNIPADR